MVCLKWPPQRKMTSHGAGHMVLGQTIFVLLGEVLFVT